MSREELKKLLAKLVAGNPTEENIYAVFDYMESTEEEEPAPPVQPAAKKTSRKKKASNGISTSRADITPLREWVTISRAAEESGISEAYIKERIQEGILTTVTFAHFTLIHYRQLKNWVDAHRELEVYPEVLEDWAPLSTVEKNLGARLAYHVEKGNIAHYCPGGALKLVNYKECKAFKDSRQ